MNPTTNILINIAHTEPTTFRELLRDLGDDKPTNKDEYRQLFLTLEMFEASGLVEIERSSNDKIDTLILTDLGAERAREALKGQENGF